jgi:hypothetical protein
VGAVFEKSGFIPWLCTQQLCIEQHEVYSMELVLIETSLKRILPVVEKRVLVGPALLMRDASDPLCLQAYLFIQHV